MSKMRYLAVAAFFLITSCSTGDRPDTGIVTDPETILSRGGLSHGIGYGPLDSPLLEDSINASLVVATADGLGMKAIREVFDGNVNLDARIDSLIEEGILEKKNDKIYPAFPVILAGKRRDYFSQITADAALIQASLMPGLQELILEAGSRGWEKWDYHIVWSLLFDSQFIWYKMVERKMVPPLTDLVSWVIFPPHAAKTGTNYYPNDDLRDFWVVVSWCPGDNGVPQEMGMNWKKCYEAAEQPGLLSGQDLAFLRKKELLDEKDEVVFPIISENDPFYGRLDSLTDLYLALMEKVPVEPYRKFFRENDQRIFCYIYHDISWEILDKLQADKMISRPDALNNGDPETAAGIISVISVYQPFVDQVLEALGP